MGATLMSLIHKFAVTYSLYLGHLLVRKVGGLV